MQNYQSQLKALEFNRFLVKSDWHGLAGLLANYGIIALMLMIVVYVPNVFTVLLALVLLGNRQLGLGILMHDCVHGALFRHKQLNAWVGEYLCAAPILAQFEGYRRYHLKHHAKAGTEDDPDYPNYRGYPVTKRSMVRKIFRDLSGVTGLKNMYILMLMHVGVVEYDMSYQSSKPTHPVSGLKLVEQLIRNLLPSLVFYGVFTFILWMTGTLWLLWIWWGAYLTTFMLFSRIRNAAEHAAVPDLLDKDPRLHARTVYANWLERMTVAPNYVNYHLEHHWLPAVPPHQLPAFHAFLQHNGLLDGVKVASGYREVMASICQKNSDHHSTV